MPRSKGCWRWERCFSQRENGFNLSFDKEEPIPLRSRDVALYRITQEGLTNAIHHVEATQLKRSITREEHESDLSLTISDSGKGFDLRRLKKNPTGFAFAELKNALNIWAEPLPSQAVGEATTIIIIVKVPELQQALHDPTVLTC